MTLLFVLIKFYFITGSHRYNPPLHQFDMGILDKPLPSPNNQTDYSKMGDRVIGNGCENVYILPSDFSKNNYKNLKLNGSCHPNSSRFVFTKLILTK